MKKWFAFEVKSGVNQLGRDTYYWVVTSKYATKKAVLEAYNTPRCARKVTKVYTLKELLITYGKNRTKEILTKTRPFWINEYQKEK